MSRLKFCLWLSMSILILFSLSMFNFSQLNLRAQPEPPNGEHCSDTGCVPVSYPPFESFFF